MKKERNLSRVRFTVNTTLATAAVFLLSLSAAFAQNAAPSQQPAPLKKGIRFVVRDMSDKPLSELFALSGDKEHPVMPLRLSGRLPSERVAWDANRAVTLYKDEPPVPESGKIKTEELPPPYISATIPDAMSNKVLGLIVLAKEARNNRIFYLDEENFRTGGIHAVNFTSSRIKITLAKKADFSDKVDFILAPFRNSEGITSKNSWNFVPKSSAETYSFVISAIDEKGQEQRIRSSRFNTARGISQINLFVRDGKGRISMSSINLDD